MITKVNYDSTKEKSVINGFLTELNNCIDQYNSILEEVDEASVWIDHEYERAVKENLFIIHDRASVFNESYIYNIISDELKVSLNTQLDVIRDEILIEREKQQMRMKNNGIKLNEDI